MDIVSFSGGEPPLEFPEGEEPPEAGNLATSAKENDKSNSPVRFIKSSNGTVKISSVATFTPK